MKINEYYDNWNVWRNKDLKELKISMEEYIILDNYMEYVYNLMVELKTNDYIKTDNIEHIVPNLIKLEFKKVN